MKRRLTLTSYLLSAVFFLFLCTTQHILAATLSLSPGTGVYQVGGTFTANVVVNTSGQAINAADATISFDTAQLSVVNVSRGPIFGLWVTEPTFSNSAGTISFSGGSPSGYTGSAGTVMSVTFRTKAAGTGRVSFKNGSVLANDGKGTNVLTAMNGGSFTVQAQTAEPTPEVIVEYVAPANTPGAPTVSVEPAPNEAGWLRTNSMSLSWSVPAGVTGVRTLLDESAQTIPTKVYDAPINSIDLSDLDEGVSYFHIQFRNADGWGRVTHVPLRVDTERPTSLVVSQSEPIDVSNPIQILHVEAKDATSPVTRYKLKIDSGEPFEVELESATGTIELPAVDPGYHTVTVEAFDAAGNSIVETYAFTVEAFDRPVFTEYPHELTPGIIPVIKGQTRPHSEVEITLTKLGTEPRQYHVSSDESGEFVFIPESSFETGVYELTAVATDSFGAQSGVSEAVRIAVQAAGYVRIGGLLISVLSVLVPSLALLLLSILLLLWFMKRARDLRQSLRTESGEALTALEEEFSQLERTLAAQEKELCAARKSKQLTKAEESMINSVRASLNKARTHIKAEITDVTDLTK